MTQRSRILLDVPVSRLDLTLNTYLEKRKIDFMPIDVEGSEMLVLSGNDWNNIDHMLFSLRYKIIPRVY